MIRRKGECIPERRVIGGGNGELLLRKKFNQDELYGKCRVCTEITLEPGQSIGRHAHTGEFEIFYMLSGQLLSVQDDDSTEPFRAGDMMITGGGESHSLRNESAAPATILAMIVNG